MSDGDALVPAAKFLKDASALGQQAVGEGADVVYVAVGHGLVVDLLTLFMAEIAAIQPVHIGESPAGLILMAAGQRDLQRCPHRARPVLTHGMDHESFKVEGIADHITQTELL